MNTQLSLLDLLPPGKILAMQGLKRCIAKAEKDNKGWAEATFKIFVEEFLPVNDVFQMESFRSFLALKEDYEFPANARSFGFIPLRAKREGRIECIGTRSTQNESAHNCYASLWRRIDQY